MTNTISQTLDFDLGRSSQDSKVSVDSTNTLELNVPNPFPELVIAKLVSLFDLSQKRTARLVSNEWRCEVERATHFKGAVSNENVDLFLTSLQPFEEVCIQNLNNPSLFKTTLQADLGFPEIKSLAIAGSTISAEWILYILEHIANNVKQIKFWKSLEHMPPETVSHIGNNIAFKELTKLSIDVDFRVRADFEKVTMLFELLTIPTLKTLGTHVKSPLGYHDLLLTHLCIEFYKFLVRHDSSLTSLHCTFETNLTLGRFSDVFNKIIFRIMPQLTNLQTLHFRTTRMELNHLARAIMNETSKLVSLTFIEEMNPYMTDESLLDEVLRRNGATLRYLMVKVETFDTRCLKPCVNLVTLHIRVEQLVPHTYENFNLKSLTECRVELTKFCDDNFTFIMNNMSNVSTFIFGPGDFTVGVGICRRLGDLLESKGSKLEHISLETPRIDLNWFKQCIVVKTLQIGGPTMFVNLFNSGHGVNATPTLKSFKIYDSGFSENFAIRLLGLKPSLVGVISGKGRDWPTTHKMLYITKKAIPGVIHLTVERYADDGNGRRLTITNTSECREIIGIDPTENQYEVFEIDRSSVF